MGLTRGTNTISDIFRGNNKIGKIFRGVNLIYETTPIVAPPYLNYTGIDANNVLEGQLAYTGNAVAYAIGKPTISFSTEGNELVSYSYDNGFNSEYYDNYDFTTRVQEDPSLMTFIVPEIIQIPDKYNGKPVTRILPYSFFGMLTDSQYSYYYQAYNIKQFVLNKNITTLEDYCLRGLSQLTELNLRNVTTINEYALANCSEIILSPKVNKLSEFAFKGTGKVKVTAHTINGGFNSMLTIFADTVYNTGSLVTFNNTRNFLEYVFEHTVNQDINVNLGTRPKTAQKISVYTDNQKVADAPYGDYNTTAYIYTLNAYINITNEEWPKLSTPTTSISGNILTITPVTNATNYDIYSGSDSKFLNTTDTTIDLSQYLTNSGNQNYIRVVAKANGYAASDFSTTINYVAP